MYRRMAEVFRSMAEVHWSTAEVYQSLAGGVWRMGIGPGEIASTNYGHKGVASRIEAMRGGVRCTRHGTRLSEE